MGDLQTRIPGLFSRKPRLDNSHETLLFDINTDMHNVLGANLKHHHGALTPDITLISWYHWHDVIDVKDTCGFIAWSQSYKNYTCH